MRDEVAGRRLSRKGRPCKRHNGTRDDKRHPFIPPPYAFTPPYGDDGFRTERRLGRIGDALLDGFVLFLGLGAELDPLGHDFGAEALYAILIFPQPVADHALHEHPTAFLQKLGRQLARLAERHHVVEGRLFRLPALSIVVDAVGRDAKAADRRPGGERARVRIGRPPGVKPAPTSPARSTRLNIPRG
jgi:hypothetical protein